MRGILRTAVLASAVAVGTLGLSGEADAACCVAYDYADAKSNTRTIITDLTSQIDAMQLAVVEALKMSAGERRKLMKAQMLNEQRIRDAQNKLENKRWKDRERTKAAQRAMSDRYGGCKVQTGMEATEGLGQSRDTYKAAVDDMLTDVATGTDGAKSGGDKANGYKGAAQEHMAGRIQEFADKFCNAELKRAGVCDKISDPVKRGVTPSRFPVAAPEPGDNLTLDADEQAAATQFITNVALPNAEGIEPDIINKKDVGSALRELSGRIETRSVKNVGTSVLSGILAEKTAMEGVKDADKKLKWAKALISEHPEIGPEAVKMPDGSEAVSPDLMNRLQADQWHHSSEWQKRISATAEPMVVYKDIARMMAFQTSQNRRLREAVRKLTAVQAVSLIVDARAKLPMRGK